MDYVTPLSGEGVQIGNGAPNINTPISTIYVNSANGNAYTNPTSVSGAWVLVTGGSGSGVPQVYTGTYADPNVQNLVPDDPTRGAWFYQAPAATPYNVWYWDTVNQTWIQFSAP